MAATGASFNARLSSSKVFRNPAFLRSVVTNEGEAD